MNTNKILIALLFLIAFVLLAVALFYPKFIDSDLEPLPPEEQPIVLPEPESTEKTIWKTSRNHFTIEASSELWVMQRDAGDISTITIYRPEDSNSRNWLTIELGLSSTLDGTPISLDTWINEQLINADKIEACDGTGFGGETAQCFIVTERDEVHKEYYGVADTLTYFKVIVGIEPTLEVLQAISTLNFNPLEADLAEAQIIP